VAARLPQARRGLGSDTWRVQVRVVEMKQQITDINDLKPPERVICITQQLGVRHYSGDFHDYERVKSYIQTMNLTAAEYDECIRAAYQFIGV
jgi:hypothetical protein